AGAAGSAAAETLRREGVDGAVVLIDPDPAAPYDRPNLSKDYLAGTAPEEGIPLRPGGVDAEDGLERVVDRVESVDRERRRGRRAGGGARPGRTASVPRPAPSAWSTAWGASSGGAAGCICVRATSSTTTACSSPPARCPARCRCPARTGATCSRSAPSTTVVA